MVLHFVYYLFLAVCQIDTNMPKIDGWYRLDWNGREIMGQIVDGGSKVSSWTFQQYSPRFEVLSIPKETPMSQLVQKTINLLKEETTPPDKVRKHDKAEKLDSSGEGLEITDEDSVEVAEGLDPDGTPINPYKGAENPLQHPVSTPEDEPKKKGWKPDTVAKIAIVGVFAALAFSL